MRWCVATVTTEVYNVQDRPLFAAVGNLTNINYAVSIDIRLQYDALNRLTNMVDAAGVTRLAYTAFGALLSEDGPWENDTVTYDYDSGRRRKSLALQLPNTSSWSQSYTHDAMGRLDTLSSPAGTFGYKYIGAGSLMTNLSLPMGAAIANSYDLVGRLTATMLKASGGAILSSNIYIYDLANQRMTNARSSNVWTRYAYDPIGQLKTSAGYDDNSAPRDHEDFRYSYDGAGNLTNRVQNQLTNNFTVNNLNQLTTGSRSGTLTVAGTLSGPATSVTVNSLAATTYSDNTFARAGFGVTDGLNSFTAVAQDSLGRTDSNTVSANLPAAPSFAYDANGNLTNDSQRMFQYDDENQLTNVTVAGQWKSDFVYDGKMRRRIRKEYTWQNGTWALTNEVRYIYDGNLVIQERNSYNLATMSYVRGNDLSGTRQGAGGIGSLLARTDHATLKPQHAYYYADDHGNITALIDTNQNIVARYAYNPFGTVISMSGPLADVNLYRFSSKETHVPSGFIYYLYRYYNPDLQRWLNRDPAGETWQRNLYSAFRNSPTSIIDDFGLRDVAVVIPPIPTPDTNIRKCNRKLDENAANDFVLGVANIRGHDYFDWPDSSGGRDGIGFQNPQGKDGDLPTSEKGSNARRSCPCRKTDSPLKHGKGKGKTGKNASDEEIQDCLKSRPIKGNYHGIKNNSNDWCRGAEKDCGLQCP